MFFSQFDLEKKNKYTNKKVLKEGYKYFHWSLKRFKGTLNVFRFLEDITVVPKVFRSPWKFQGSL